MGCVESNAGIPDVDEDAAQGQASRASISSPEEQRKKKRKISLRKKSARQKKQVDAEKSGLAGRTESAKVTVIWRRWSLFNSTHESFNKHLEGEAAGTSGRPTETPQISNISAESVV